MATHALVRGALKLDSLHVWTQFLITCNTTVTNGSEVKEKAKAIDDVTQRPGFHSCVACAQLVLSCAILLGGIPVTGA